MYRLSLRDYALAGVGITIIIVATLWLIFIAKPPPGPVNGSMGANESPAKLYPVCEWWPDGVNGQPCLDGKEFERSGRMVFYDHWKGPHHPFPDEPMAQPSN